MAQFYDEVTINIESWKGGNGIVAARREAKVPFWWPAGGNGGNGGSMIFVASKDENTLLPYRYKKIFKAKSGESGKTKDQYGANAEHTYLTVPVGTIIKDAPSWEILYQLTEDKQERTALPGWEWGKGNIFFKDSVNQYPNFALYGEPGQKREVILELQLLADVALIGTPSVGKTSIINTISHTKAKVAEYPFTTLIPNLGSINVGDYNFNMIDIPWLIEGSAEGRWLGNAFLRHILKSRVFCFVLDASRFDTGIQEFWQLLEEIFEYIKQRRPGDKKTKTHCTLIDNKWWRIYLEAKHGKTVFLKKTILIAINKYDLINDQELMQEYITATHKHINETCKKEKIKIIPKNVREENTFIISAFTHYGIERRLERLTKTLRETPGEFSENIQRFIVKEEKSLSIQEVTKKEKSFLIEEWYIDTVQSKYSKVREVNDKAVAKLVYMLPWWNDEGEMRFRKTLDQMNILDTWHQQWIQKWDIIKIVSHYEGVDNRYILY